MKKRFARITCTVAMAALLISGSIPAGIASEKLQLAGQPGVAEWRKMEPEAPEQADSETDAPDMEAPQEDPSPDGVPEDGREAPADESGSSAPERTEEKEAATGEAPDDYPEPEGNGEELDQEEIDEGARRFSRQYSGGRKPGKAALSKESKTYEVESNDTFEKADYMFAGSNAFGRIRSSSDVDTWKIEPRDHGTLTFTLSLPPSADYDIYVYDREKRELGNSKNSEGKVRKVENIGVEKKQRYYVRVVGNNRSYNDQLYYQLRADLRTGQERKPDPYEPNNSIRESAKLEAAQITANLHRKEDVDYYQFSVKKASTIVVKLTDIPETMDLDIQLFDGNSKQVASSEKTKNKDEEIVYNGDPGTYYIKVYASRSSAITNHAYRLSLQTHTIPIILIPGIGGSRLQAEEEGEVREAWLGLVDIGFGIGDLRHRIELALKPAEKNSVNVVPYAPWIKINPEGTDGGFRAIESLSYTIKFDYVEKRVEQYLSMVKRLEEEGYTKNKDLFAMPYDWRLSNKDNAKYLKQKIDEALQTSGAKQVQLVAHSMGGLLVRETLLTTASYQPKVKRIVYMGTPFLGSPRAYQAIKFGYNFGIPVFHEGAGKAIAEYAPAVYELLPSRTLFEKELVLKRDPVYGFPYNAMLEDDRVKLDYLPLLKHADTLHSKWDNKTIRVPQYAIIGFGQTTLKGYEYFTGLKVLRPFFESAGDGTVTLASANYGQKDILKKFYVAEEHAQLPKNPQVIEQVVQLTRGNDRVQPGLRHTANTKNDYLYYILYREDGEFPEITFTKSGQTIEITPDQREEWEDLRIEYHGNTVVIHVLDHEPLTFTQSRQSRKGNSSAVQIETYSSKDKADPRVDEDAYKRKRGD